MKIIATASDLATFADKDAAVIVPHCNGRGLRKPTGRLSGPPTLGVPAHDISGFQGPAASVQSAIEINESGKRFTVTAQHPSGHSDTEEDRVKSEAQDAAGAVATPALCAAIGEECTHSFRS